jgi:hypothetical protein
MGRVFYQLRREPHFLPEDFVIYNKLPVALNLVILVNTD